MPNPAPFPEATDLDLRRAFDGETPPRTLRLLYGYLSAEQPPASISRDQFAAELASILTDAERVEILSDPFPFRWIAEITTGERMLYLSLLMKLLYAPA